ncbi:ArdC-like ssDNA-binding domain-containing protein, partial [Escherichia coli]
GMVSGIPSNFTTDTSYSGINIMLLWCSAAKQGFNDSRWLTYKQAQALGAQVRKGERGTMAIFYRMLEKETEDGGIEQIPMLKTFTVFNVEQIDGLTLTDEDSTAGPVSGFDPLPHVE